MNFIKTIDISAIKPFFYNKKRNYLILTQIANVIIGLISGKLIAEFILPEQFGLYNLQYAVFTFFFTLLIGPSIQFFKSTYHNFLGKVGIKYYLITLGWLCILAFIFIILFFKLYKPDANLNAYLFLIILFLLIFNTISRLIIDQLNIMNRLNEFSFNSIVNSITGLLFLITVFYLFTESEKNNLVLWLMQLIIGIVGISIFIKDFTLIVKETPLVSYQSFLIKHFQFTLPLMFLAIWSWVNNYFDRFVIEHYMHLKDVGIYNANYSVGSKFYLLLNPIFLVMLTPLVYQNNTKAFKKKIISKYVKFYFVFGAPILITIWILKDFIGTILLSDFYHEGFFLIFWIALAFLIMTATYLYETILYVEQKTKLILYSNILGAISNIILNVALIPLMGLNGAVCATIASVTVRFIFIYTKFRQL